MHCRTTPSGSARVGLACFAFLVLLTVAVPGSAAAQTSFTVQKVEPLDYADVQLLPGEFNDARNLNLKYLLELDLDRLLHPYLREAGFTPRAPHYGGWENSQISGTACSFYLAALCIENRTSPSAELQRRIRYIVDEWERCQKAHGDGYLSGIPRGKQDCFAKVSAGSIKSNPAALNDFWTPWYVVHKTMLGLREAYRLAGIAKAKDMLIAKADWVDRTTRNLSEEQLERMLTTEFGGMPEVLLDVYEMTGDRKYLAAADRFYHNAVLDPMERRKDPMNGLHGNTQVPKLIGETRRYELVGDEKDRAIAEFFWNIIVNDHSYAMGGHSDGEHLGPPRRLANRLGTMTAEHCNTYHMLKLTRRLIAWDPKAEYADFCERAIYNHIRASQEPRHGRYAYFTTLMPGHFRTYSTPEDAFWCCVVSGFESHARYIDSIYFRNPADSSLYVNLFIPSRVSWREKNLTIAQTSKYPYEDTIQFDVSTSSPTYLTLRIRRPWWLEKEATFTINGERVPAKPESGYFVITREWKDGDRLQAQLPMTLRSEPMPDNPKRIALFYGPLMLAARLGNEGMEPPVPFHKEHTGYLQAKLVAAPVVVAGTRPPAEWLEVKDRAQLIFRTKGVGNPADFEVAPFYNRYYERYTAFLDTFTEEEWAAKQAEYKAEAERVRKLEGRTIDMIRPGEPQPEVDHKFQGHETRTGMNQNRKWRDATPGGWFSYRLKVDPGVPNKLMVTYWGSDVGNRTFQITADGKLVKEMTLNNQAPERFFSEEYELPAEAIAGKTDVELKFQGIPGHMAGGIFEVRNLRPE